MRLGHPRDDYDLEALEPRLLLSADPIASLLDTSDEPKDQLGDSVSVAMMQSADSEVSAAAEQQDDFFDVEDEPLTAPAEPVATPAVE